MQIQKIEAEGFRTLAGVVPLTGKTVLRGPVGSGKSSVLDALRFAVLGYVPRFGRRPMDTARVMRGSSLRVTVTLADGRTFTRALLRFGGESRSDVSASWVKTGAHEAIVSLFGRSEEEAAEVLDVRELLDAAPADRTRRVEAVLAAAAPSGRDLAMRGGAYAVIRLARADGITLPAATEDLLTLSRATSSALQPDVREAAGRAWREIGPVLGDRGPVVAVEKAKERKLAARAEAKRCSEVANALEASQGQATEPVAVLRERREALLATKAQAEAAAAVRARWDRATASLLAARSADGTLDPRLLAEARAQVESLRAAEPAPEDLPAEVALEVERLQAEAKSLHEAANRVAVRVHDTKPPALLEVPNVHAAQAAAREAVREADAAAASPWTVVLAELDVAAANAWAESGVGEEATVRRVIAAFEPVRAIAEANRPGDVAVLRGKASAAYDAMKHAEKDAQRVEAENATRMQAWREAVDAERADRDEARKLREQAQAAESRAASAASFARAAAQAAWRQREVQRVRDLAAAERKVRILEEQASAERAAAALAERQATEARKVLDEIGTEPPAAAASSAELSAALLDLDAKIDVAARKEGRAEVVRANQAAALKESNDEAAFAAIEWAMARLRDEVVADRSGPVVATMRQVLGGAFPSEALVPFLRSGKGGPEFGWTRDGADVPLAALSGGETALFMAALSVALVRIREPEVPLLLVEGAELGAGDVAAAVLAAVGDLPDVQVVLASVQPPEAGPAWSRVTLGGGRAVGAA